MDIYLDLAVLLNFLVDYLLLYGTEKLSGGRGSRKRIFLAALLGAVYGATCLLPEGKRFSGGFWPFVVMAFMCVVAYGISYEGLRRGLVFFLLSMALGGLASGIGVTSGWSLVLAGAVIWLVCLLGIPEGKKGGAYIPVVIEHKGRALRLTALVDTGNTLKDPLSGKPVLVVDALAGNRLLDISPQELQRPLETVALGKYKGLRLIPYASIGQPAGMLLAVKPERVYMDGKQADVLVAFAPQRIGQGKNFNALVGGAV